VAEDNEAPKGKGNTRQKGQNERSANNRRSSSRPHSSDAFSDNDPFEKYQKKSKKRQLEAESRQKPSREERGYTSPRGPKKKDDWKQFFQQNDRPFRGEEPDFNEEGWARRAPKKK
jgi:ATP-dependent RNA helicase DeaD